MSFSKMKKVVFWSSVLALFLLLVFMTFFLVQSFDELDELTSKGKDLITNNPSNDEESENDPDAPDIPDIPVLPAGNWLFSNEYFSSGVIRTDLPSLESDMLYTCFVNGIEVGPVDYVGAGLFRFENFKWRVFYDRNNSAWALDAVDSSLTGARLSIRNDGKAFADEIDPFLAGDSSEEA